MTNQIERRHLAVFVAVAQELHFGRAAKRLHVTQPAVTQTIQNLEDYLDVTLLDRTTRRVRLTSAGHGFLAAAKQLLSQFDDAIVAAREADQRDAGVIRIAYSGALSLYPIPDLVGKLALECPGIKVELQRLSSQEQLEALATGRCDLACPFSVSGSPRAAHLCVHEWERHPLVAVLAASDPRAQKKTLDFGELVRDPVVTLTYRNEPEIRNVYRLMVQQFGHQPRIAAEVDQLDGMLALVAQGLGVSFVPKTVTGLRRKGVRYVRVTPTVEIPVTLVWSQHNANPTLQRALALIDPEL